MQINKQITAYFFWEGANNISFILFGWSTYSVRSSLSPPILHVVCWSTLKESWHLKFHCEGSLLHRRYLPFIFLSTLSLNARVISKASLTSARPHIRNGKPRLFAWWLLLALYFCFALSGPKPGGHWPKLSQTSFVLTSLPLETQPCLFQALSCPYGS